jgi:hypothetical protein
VHLTASIRPGASLLPRLDGADGVTGAERLRTLVIPSASNLSTESVDRPSQPARRSASTSREHKLPPGSRPGGNRRDPSWERHGTRFRVRAPYESLVTGTSELTPRGPEFGCPRLPRRDVTTAGLIGNIGRSPDLPVLTNDPNREGSTSCFCSPRCP